MNLYSEEAKERYAAHMKVMSIQPELKEWAQFMVARYGAKVQLHFSHYTDWVLALMIVRYGEAEGYDLILNNRVLLYHATKYQVTDPVLKGLNKKYEREK